MSPPKTGIRSRPATQDDLPILWDFVAIAAYEPDADAAKAVPFVAAHLAGWQRPEDFGFIAERDGAAIGAAWARQFTPDEQPAFFVDEHTPEITIGVKPQVRGRGVGRMLLHALFTEAARRGVGLSSMPATTIRRAASTSASAFASCRGQAFRTGSAARHSGCGGPHRSPSPPFRGEREGPGAPAAGG